MKGSKIIGFSLVVLFITGCSREREEYWNGRAFATEDIKNGSLRIAYADGVSDPAWWSDYDKLLQQKYGIRWVIFSLPDNPSAAAAAVRGYNEVSRPEIEKRFGTNILERAVAEAKKEYESRRKPNAK